MHYKIDFLNPIFWKVHIPLIKLTLYKEHNYEAEDCKPCRPTDSADKKGYECEIVMQELAMFYVLATSRVFRYILYLFLTRFSPYYIFFCFRWFCG